jgi:hypothetical protein
MFAFLKSERFSILASFIVGLGLVSIFIPRCENCYNYKAGNTKEIDNSVYQIGSKCYHFQSEIITCPQSNEIIESFRH